MSSGVVGCPHGGQGRCYDRKASPARRTGAARGVRQSASVTDSIRGQATVAGDPQRVGCVSSCSAEVVMRQQAALCPQGAGSLQVFQKSVLSP